MKHSLRFPVLNAFLSPMKLRAFFAPAGLAALVAFGGCLQVQVKPIHITVDVNVRAEKALNDFFGELDQKSTTVQHAPATP